MKPSLTRDQRLTILYAVLCLMLLLIVLQLWLLTATMNAYMGGDETVILPAAIASLLCFFCNAALLRYVLGLERPRGGSHHTSKSPAD